MNLLTLWIALFLGLLVGFLCGCLPGVHVYLLLAPLPLLAGSLPPYALATGLATAIGAWTVAGLLPALVLTVPDESTFLFLPAGAATYRQGQSQSALNSAAAGALAGALLLVAAGYAARPFLPLLLPILRPHFHWMLWAIILFLLFSEWHPGQSFTAPGWRSAVDAAGPSLAALASFTLSGLLGLLLWSRPFLPPHKAGLSLMPVFAGLFSVPSLLLAIGGSSPPVPQSPSARSFPLLPWIKGALAGAAGGWLAILLPALSGGVGAWMANQAIASSDRRSFLAAQGAARMVYYGGTLLLFGAPEFGLIRGSAAWNLLAYVPRDLPALSFLLPSALLVATGLSFLLIEPVGLWLLRRTQTLPARRCLLIFSLTLLTALIAATTALPGLALLSLATSIGFLPILFRCRRVHLLGVILLPTAFALSGNSPL